MGILSTYTEFKNFEPTYNKWYENQKLSERKAQSVLVKKPITTDVLNEQQRAKILVDTLTSIDEYAQTKAEDVDSVSQTLLYVSVGALGAIGTFVGSHASKFVKNQKVAKSLPSLCSMGLALASFVPIVKTTVDNQVRANRFARFDGMHDKLFHVNNFAILTDEQKDETQKLAKNIPDSAIDSQNSIINRANIFNSLSVFKDLTMKQGEFKYLKNQHDQKLLDDSKKLKTVQFSDEEINQSKKDKKLFNKVLQKVDMGAHYPLEKIEKGVNVAYSSLFAGGVLEYLVSDGILDLLKVKNKVLRPVLSWGLPVLTILSLNKQLANFLNDAVKAIRFKKMQEFLNDTNNFKECSQDEIDKNKEIPPENDKKIGYIEFFKNTLQDIKDYKKYQATKGIEEKKCALAVRNIKLTQKQQNDAKLFKRNTEMMINTLDDQTQKYASAMETITESTTIPLDIISPAAGTFIADKVHKNFFPQVKHNLGFKVIGALVAFLPAAMSEIYFVGEQRSAKRCATLIASNNLQNHEKFLDPTEKENQTKDAIQKWTFQAKKSNAFVNFKQGLN